MFSNRCVLKQEDVDCKIGDTLLKRGTKVHTDGWDTHRKTWSHMVLQKSNKSMVQFLSRYLYICVRTARAVVW